MQTRRILFSVAVLCLGVTSPTIADVFDMPATATGLEFVAVGDLYNSPDDTGHGGVNYGYRIGKYEVTNAQYAEFLNAVASTDTHGLYNPDMASGWADTGGIVRSGAVGSLAYSARPGRENLPVNYVSFWDACRFANWLHNDQPSGQQDVGTTESGAYDLNGVASPEGMGIVRNADAAIFLPSEDEWYKAAYYSPALNGGLGGYFDYPTGTDATPSNTLTSPDPGNNANFNDYGYSDPVAPFTTPVGEFENSQSPYGTFDQGGNISEWSELVPDVFGASCTRGGSWSNGPVQNLLASAWQHTSQPTETYDLGFRVAAIPEPATLSLLALGGLAMLRRKKEHA